MNSRKNLFSRITGYWPHKTSELPIGFDLERDIITRIEYGEVNVIFDVGANTGQSYTLFRKMFLSANIFSFEPISTSFNRLITISSNDINSVTENIALGEKSEEISVSLFEDNSPRNSLRIDIMNPDLNASTQSVRIEKLDDYCSRKNVHYVDLLKIDTEGYELLVLEGGKQMFQNKKIGMVFCEVGFMANDNRHTNFNLLSDVLAQFGFVFFGLYNLSIDAWKFGDYYGDALFVHSSKVKSSH